MTDINSIHSILIKLPAERLTGLKRLFWEELNYDHTNQPISTQDWDAGIKDQLAELPILFATACSGDGFHVIYTRVRTEKMSISLERALINKLITGHPHSLFIFSNLSQTHWHFVNAVHEKDEQAHRRRVLRRISVSAEDRLRTASERIARLDTTLAGADLFGLDPFKLQTLHEEAFDVEAVTEEFFEDYKRIFTLLKNDLAIQSKDLPWAHDFALQFMNRLMFLYYIERKRWLGNDPDFLHSFWKAYRQTNQPRDTFVSDWLKLLFFNAFNKPKAPAVASAAHIPENFRNALMLAPWLNGGLFAENKLDGDHSHLIRDNLMKEVFDFLDQYNFTISEDTPLDQEVAVDPEMIGKVYESLVNVSSEADERGDAGIFYTPRIEIDLMCRLSLVDWLSNQLTDIDKKVFYEFVFAFSPEDKSSADAELTRLNLWPVIDPLLTEVTVLDPACGSGSFLVGMLMILDDLLARCAIALGKVETAYERRKRVVASSLYGVDIMEWAVHVAELRLWLQLVIDTEIDENELRLRPLLPNLSFKIRCGDSLVQEIGGLNFSLRQTGGQLRRDIAGKITALKTDKLDYFNNQEPRKFQTLEQVEHAEYLLFREIVEEELRSKVSRQAELNQALSPSRNLFGEMQNAQMKLDAVNKQHELDQVNESISKLKPALEVLKTSKDIPFVWDVAFVEIFEGGKEGFDIVVGNPPYIRQEKIRDPGLRPEDVTAENKQAYKAKLARMVYAIYPRTFGFNAASGQAAWSLDKKSDYYIYFYFICLSLLNDKGSFCFITSNSWLDVGYGSDLQRFLLTRSKVKLILDNQVKRSFRSADVNTIIALLARPQDDRQDLKPSLAHNARFVMFQVPFENGLSPVLWEEVEEAQGRATTAETRVVVKKQAGLLESGMDAEKGVYAGDKWGGKYLRAPDIYWVIMEKCRDKLVRLGDIADVRRGITTGANEFFYLDQAKIDEWGIEGEFLVPIIFSLKEIKCIEDDLSRTKNFMFKCHQQKRNLKGTKALEYIEWGEAEGFHHRPSCKSRALWYSLAENWNAAPFIFPAKIGERYLVLNNLVNSLEDKKLYGITPRIFSKTYWNIVLNCTYTLFDINLNCRQLTGAQAIADVDVSVTKNLLVIDEKYLDIERAKIAYSKNAKRIINSHIIDEVRDENRISLDQIVFEGMGLNREEKKAVYAETLRIIHERLSKAESV